MPVTLSMVLRIAEPPFVLPPPVNGFLHALSAVILLIALLIVVLACVSVFSANAEQGRRAERILRAMLKFSLDIVRIIIGAFRKAP